MDEYEALRDELARLGPFFALPDVAAGPDWRPFTALTDPVAVRALVETTRRRLAGSAGVPVDAVERRPAASIAMMDWTARLLSPALGSTALRGLVPRLRHAVWRADPHFTVALAAPDFVRVGLPADIARPSTTDPLTTAVDAFTHEVIAPILTLVDAVAESFAMSRTVLIGNVASSANGALTVLTHQRPELRDRTTAIVTALLERALPGSGQYEAADGRRRYRRASCCLFYRLPSGGYCGDCVLVTCDR